MHAIDAHTIPALVDKIAIIVSIVSAQSVMSVVAFDRKHCDVADKSADSETSEDASESHWDRLWSPSLQSRNATVLLGWCDSRRARITLSWRFRKIHRPRVRRRRIAYQHPQQVRDASDSCTRSSYNS